MGRRAAAETALVAMAAVVDLVVWGGDTELRSGGHTAGYLVVVATVAVYAVLPARWDRPRSVFAAQLVFASSGLVLTGFAPFVGVLVALYALARRSTGGPAAAALVSCLVPFTVDSVNGALAGDRGTRLESFAVALALWSATSFTVWGLARLALRAEARAEMLRSLETLSAARAERLRLARELHDSVANAVTAMLLQAAGAKAALPGTDPGVARVLGDIETAGVGAMEELHRMLHLLRSGAAADQVDDVDPVDRVDSCGGAPLDLGSLVATARAAGLDVDLVTRGDPVAVPPDHRVAVRRLVQESLANTAKHGGIGAHAVVELDWRPSGVGIRVEDQRGAAGGSARSTGTPSSGYGLVGLGERFSELGGTFDGHRTGTGFLVTAWLPASRSTNSRTADPVTR
jgi:signal transduction histidine kinase